MAYFNFLSNEASGRIGDTYYRNGRGRRQFLGRFLKTLEESQRNGKPNSNKAIIMTTRIGNHHSANINKKCWQAFASEQRLAAVFYRNFWPFLGLQKGDRNPLNVVAQQLGDLVKNHIFDPYRIYNIYAETPKISLTDPEYNEERKTFEVSYQNDEDFPAEQEPQLLFTLFKQNGENLGVKIEWAQAGDFAFPTKYFPDQTIYFLCLVAAKVDGEYKIVGSKITSTTLSPFVGETWYPQRMNNGLWQFVNPETLQGREVVSHYDDETLIFG